jgi:hypothetical protein
MILPLVSRTLALPMLTGGLEMEAKVTGTAFAGAASRKSAGPIRVRTFMMGSWCEKAILKRANKGPCSL